MAKLLQLRRGTTSQHSGFTGAEGEVTVDTDKDTLVVHDNSTAGGFPLAANASPTFTGSHIGIPSVTTANRPGESGGTNASVTAVVGMVIFNSTIGTMQQFNAQGWTSIDAPPHIASLNYPGSATALDPVGEIILTGSSTIDTDATVTVSSTTNLRLGMSITGIGIPSSTTIIEITSATVLELSANATATGSSSVSLTFNTSSLIVTGLNFQTGLTVTIDGTAPRVVTRDSVTQITITGIPAKAAATYSGGLQITNPTGLIGSADILYDATPTWTTAVGSLGTFVDGAFTNSSTAPIRIIASDASGGAIEYAQTNDAGVVNTNGIAGLVLGTTGVNAGYLTGTLNGTDDATNNFYAKPTDNEGQIGAVRLFSFISKDYPATGGTTSTYTSDGVDYVVHTFLVDTTFTAFIAMNIDYLIVGGGGGGGFGGGGGGASVIYKTGFAVTAQDYTIDIGDGGIGETGLAGLVGGSTTAFGEIVTGGGGGGVGAGLAGANGGGGSGHSSGTVAGGIGTAQESENGATVYGGNNGGPGYGLTPNYPSGGGGGANAVGGSPSPANNSGDGGDGGAGIQINIDNNNYYWAGGGGGTTSVGSLAGGTGGTGGGGGGGSWGAGGAGGASAINSGIAGTQGVSGSGYLSHGGAGGANTGGGGGGGTWSNGDGGNGGSGIVIIRYVA
tara:strand:- start:591 stop:2612 length:2022 start_codon:yes stop_codon:yes gene_type:complete